MVFAASTPANRAPISCNRPCLCDQSHSHRRALAIRIAGVFGIAIAQIVSAKIETRDQTQTAPFFSVREDPSQTQVQLPRDVWNELHPTSGEYIRIRNPRPGAGETFHFFWK